MLLSVRFVSAIQILPSNFVDCLQYLSLAELVELFGNLFGLIVAAFRLCRLEEVRGLIVPEVQG